MSIDEVVEKNTIRLPRPLGLGEAEELLYYLAKELPADIKYHISHYKSISHTSGESDRKTLEQEDGTVRINGSISNLGKPFAFDYFRLQSSDQGKDTSRLSVIAFQSIPSCELSDYRPEVIELWKGVREKVEQYFE